MQATFLILGAACLAAGFGSAVSGQEVAPAWMQRLLRIEREPSQARRCGQRLTLFHELRHERDVDAAVEVYRTFTDEMERHDGTERTQQVALAHTEQLQRKGDPETAARVAQLIVDRWPDCPVAAKAKLHQGQCLLAAGRNEAAAACFLRLVENHDGEPAATAAWEQMAIAQVKAGKRLDAIASLEVMKIRFQGTPLADAAAKRIVELRNTAGR